MWSLDFLNTNLVRYKNLCDPDQMHTKAGDKNLCILGGLFTVESDGVDRLVSQDVRGWWVARGIFGRATGITT